MVRVAQGPAKFSACRFLGCEPSTEIFRPTVIRREQMLKAVEEISHEPGVQHRNRMGILLGNKVAGQMSANIIENTVYTN